MRTVECKWCGSPFIPDDPYQSFCSADCYKEDQLHSDNKITRMSAEDQLELLQKAKSLYDKPNPFKPGDVVTQKLDNRYKFPEPGDPAIVINTYPSSRERFKEGGPLAGDTMDILLVLPNGTVRAYPVVAIDFKLYE